MRNAGNEMACRFNPLHQNGNICIAYFNVKELYFVHKLYMIPKNKR
jgi:hypothetical protein